MSGQEHLNVTLDQGEEARALHRVVRAMHDGHCPACGYLGPSGDFFSRSMSLHRCPMCRFEITGAESRAALATFRTYMERNLTVFKAWRERQRNERDAAARAAAKGD